MRPVLFSLFSLKITSYSLFLVVAFIVGTIWAGFRAKKNGLNPDILPDVIFWVFFSSLAGAKLFGIIDALFNEIKIISLDMNYFLHLLLDSGIIAYGGIIGGSIAAIIYFKKKKKDLLPYANTVAPGLGLGVFLIRIGCFLSGCC